MEKVWVLLDTDHTHAGQAHKAGALLEVERHHAQAIARMKAGHSVPAPAR
jgi:2-keto-3-deoxy-L-rhamnonate aldolase RhmA